MAESKIPPGTAEIHEFKPWDAERMFQLVGRLWQQPEEPDPEAAEVNDAAGAMCYLLCRAMESGAPAPTCPRCLDELTRHLDWPEAPWELRRMVESGNRRLCRTCRREMLQELGLDGVDTGPSGAV
ncbi:MAG: hypothetical protein OXG35_03145 [Acidobacteria bacterium]|nr:hypothetical protein [Acidobacteriota bacterium]